MDAIGARVLRVSGMPYGVTMWIDHGRDRPLIYIDRREITERDARRVEQAIRSGTIDIGELPNGRPPW